LPLDLCFELGKLAYAARRHPTLDVEAVLREHRATMGSIEDALRGRASGAPDSPAKVLNTSEPAAVDLPTLLVDRRQEQRVRPRLRNGLAAAAVVAVPLGLAGAWTLQAAPPAALNASAGSRPAVPVQAVNRLQAGPSANTPESEPRSAPAEADVLPATTPVTAPVLPPTDKPLPTQKAADKPADTRRTKRAEAELTVGAMPSALVWVDGRKIDWSPVDVKVKAGQHCVGIGSSKPDCVETAEHKPNANVERWISVRAGEHLDVIFDQQPLARGGRDER
jgi:hypothetical protein